MAIHTDLVCAKHLKDMVLLLDCHTAVIRGVKGNPGKKVRPID